MQHCDKSRLNQDQFIINFRLDKGFVSYSIIACIAVKDIILKGMLNDRRTNYRVFMVKMLWGGGVFGPPTLINKFKEIQYRIFQRQHRRPHVMNKARSWFITVVS